MWWITVDTCGLVSANLTVLLLLFANYVVVKVLILPWVGMSLHVYIYTAITALALWSHAAAQYSDPGAVPAMKRVMTDAIREREANAKLKLPVFKDGKPAKRRKNPAYCTKCEGFKPAQTHHCSSCARCVVKLDHHCPWVNNCVAIFNQKYFLLFLFYTSLCCLYSGIILGCRFLSCTRNFKMCTVDGVDLALCICCFVEALVFGLFVIIMMFDQMAAISETYTNRLKKREDYVPAPETCLSSLWYENGYASLKVVFGEAIGVKWLLPMRLPQTVYDEFAKHVRWERHAGLLAAAKAQDRVNELAVLAPTKPVSSQGKKDE